MKFSLINTRSIVIIGYCLLVVLAMTGIVTIYLELVKSHHLSQDAVLKKELINLSNTLTTMYQAEEIVSLLAFADKDGKLKNEYDSLTNRVFEQIDSLRISSSDPVVDKSIDSLSSLLLQKRKYALEMFELISKVNNNTGNDFIKRTVISRKDTARLSNILINVTQDKGDTIQIVAEKKGFLQRIMDVVKSSSDTVTHISKSSVSEKKELMVPVLVDTIIDFIHGIDKQAQERNSKIVQQLFTRQQNLYVIKELTGLQINTIMNTIKGREYQTNMDIFKEKNESLKRSSSVVAFVGISALIVVLFFMSWTLHSLNKAQQLQKSIQESKKHADELLVIRERLIYAITHDIKVPISSIIGFLDLLREDTFSQKQQYYLNNMRSSASHILDLVHNLLDFHSIEKDRSQIMTIAFSPALLIKNIYESFLPLAQKKNLSFELDSNLEEKKTYLNDPNYIRQIVNNLVSNAIKFTQEGGKVSLITFIDEQNQWKISVKDNGEGIDPADQPKIFDEFVRLDKAEKKEEGTGLGLPISKHLASMLGGSIKLESQKGKGSTFTLTVPLALISENPIFQSNMISDDSAGRILFVDDDRVQLNLFSELMKKEELPYICCSSAYEALDLLMENPADIVFADIHIPDMDGFELVKRIRSLDIPHAATVPVIACSAGFRQPESEIIAAGFNDLILKPFTVQQLLDVIEKYTPFKLKQVEICSDNNSSEWRKVMDLVADDPEAATKIIDSFVEETNTDKGLLEIAFQKKDKKAIKQISHKMLSLMRMISAQDIISILTDFERGDISNDKKTALLQLLDETIKEVDAKRQGLGIKNYELEESM